MRMFSINSNVTDINKLLIYMVIQQLQVSAKPLLEQQ